MEEGELGVLVPIEAPWMISPSVPHLRLQEGGRGLEISATFIAFFKLQFALESSGLAVIAAPGEFETSQSARGAPHRLVKVSFDDATYARLSPAFSDSEVIPEAQYDWSNVPGGVMPEESAETNVANFAQLWEEKSLCPDPRMYEVRNSGWIRDVGADSGVWRHYILLGHDEYAEVIARGFEWLPGQAVK
jgi:hypothetical protein